MATDNSCLTPAEAEAEIGQQLQTAQIALMSAAALQLRLVSTPEEAARFNLCAAATRERGRPSDLQLALTDDSAAITDFAFQKCMLAISAAYIGPAVDR